MRVQRQSDLGIAELAAAQHGVVARWQLLALGFSADAIARRLRAGRLHQVHRGVYAVGHKRLTQRGRWMAAALAGGDGAVLSHASAAALWLLPFPRRLVNVTTARQRRPTDRIRFHHSSVPDDERAVVDGIPATSVARTLLDLAATEPRWRLEKAVNEAEYRRLCDATGVRTLLDRYPRRAGTPALRALLAARNLGITRSELEDRFLSFLDAAVLPRPQFNTPIELEPGRWIQADCVWREARLIAELDGRAAHATVDRFHGDRERDRLLTVAGWRVIRVTWKQLQEDGTRLESDLRKLLAASR